MTCGESSGYCWSSSGFGLAALLECRGEMNCSDASHYYSLGDTHGEAQIYFIELEERQYEFLEVMVKAHDLPDVSKAIRCLVDYAVLSTPQVQETIWQEIRCIDC